MSFFKPSAWGVHALEQAREVGLYQVSYFLSRPFGNHLIFPLVHSSEFQDEFIEAKGGAAFQLCLHDDRPSLAQAQIFSKFGAPIVYLGAKTERFDPNVRILSVGSEYYDPNVEVIEIASGRAIAINGADQRTLFFMASPFLLDRGVVRHTLNFSSVDLNIKSLQLPWKVKSIVLLFQFYRGRNWLEFTAN